MRYFWLGILIIAGILVACSDNATPTLSPGFDVDTTTETVIEPMQINDFHLIGMDSEPPQPAAAIDGLLGDSCSAIDSVSQSREGNTISIQINVRRTTGPTIECAEIAQSYNETLLLEGAFPPGDYTLVVNGGPLAFAIFGPPVCIYDAELVEHVTVPDGSIVGSGDTFIKTWRLQNTSTCPWDGTFILAQTEGTNVLPADGLTERPLPPASPGAEVEVSVELLLLIVAPLGSEQSASFQLRTSDGEVFGVKPGVSLVVGEEGALATATTQPPTGPDDCNLGAEFVSDVTIPDSSPVEVGSTFVKTWSIQNTGTCAWDSSFTLMHVSGDLITPEQDSVSLPAAQPDQTVELTVTLLLSADAPLGSQQRSNFRLRTPDGVLFGTLFVIVTAAETQ